jgi:hypothetical protein
MDDAQLIIEGQSGESFYTYIYDATGKLVGTDRIQVASDHDIITLHLGDLAAGMYQLQLVSDSSSGHLQFVVE